MVLLPPRDYLLQLVPRDQANWADPRFIYYMAGPVKTVRVGYAREETATHAILLTVAESSSSGGRDETLDGLARRAGQAQVSLVDLRDPAERARVYEVYRRGASGQ